MVNLAALWRSQMDWPRNIFALLVPPLWRLALFCPLVVVFYAADGQFPLGAWSGGGCGLRGLFSMGHCYKIWGKKSFLWSRILYSLYGLNVRWNNFFYIRFFHTVFKSSTGFWMNMMYIVITDHILTSFAKVHDMYWSEEHHKKIQLKVNDFHIPPLTIAKMAHRIPSIG